MRIKYDETNKLLARQIKRSIGNTDNLPDDVKRLLQAVNQSYHHFERDRQLLERAMEISSKELRESYEKFLVQVELERKNTELEQFVSIASHDLKAPLRTVSSFTRLLERELGAGISNNAQEYLEFIKSSIGGMDLLIKNLLVYAKLGMNSKEKEPIDLNEILVIVQKNLFGIIEDNQALINVDNLPVIEAYPSQIIQLFQNLIGNAVKFKKDGCLPVVNVRFKETSEELVFSIEDNGIGIAEKYHDRVFEVFQRLEKVNGYEGTGLGLSICAKIVNNLNGKIWLESESNIGTTFFFTFPVSAKIKDNSFERVAEKSL